ncbi:MAG: GspE/PulE family protein [Candidatus Paceibacterota bacterium]|jgi:type II secretory ATPase GspE/PulE/Tfp pilus assembly ATPase PilB-like protein|nr:GspE/PulE family protein [Candidatus Paceibacterota bacterium]
MLLKRKGDLETAAIARDPNAQYVPQIQVMPQTPPPQVNTQQTMAPAPAPAPRAEAFTEAPRPVSDMQRMPMPERTEQNAVGSRLVATREVLPASSEEEEFTPTNWLNNIFMEAMRLNVSDIHIIPERDYTSVRFRVDGVISEVAKWDIDYHEMVLSRIKIISGLQVVEKNIPQDGHIELLFEQAKTAVGWGQKGASSLNFRVSTMPTINGEAAVLRVLSKENCVLTLDQIGLSDKSLFTLRKILQRGHGVVLMTGYSGSGKTTTLYAALNEIDANQKVIITLEDPVEYRVPMIQQSQVNPMAGYHFDTGLKAILRQDPDVIMIGEIRDDETANIAMRLAMVGRLVLTTLHTNSIVGALTRVSDMGITRSVIAAAFMGVVAERLVRKICPACRQESTPPYELMKMFNIEWPEGDKVYAGRGCDACGQTGFVDRVGIFEIMEVDRDFENVILQDSPTESLEQYVKKHVTETLREDGFDKVRKGITTLEEVIRATI